MNFTLKDKEYIELNKLLKMVGVAESGGMAHQLIDDKQVKVNSEIELRRRRKLRVGDVIECFDQKIIVD